MTTSELLVSAHVADREDRARVVCLTIERPQKLNTLDPPTIAALSDAARALHTDPELRAVVLTGAGERAFIGGADLGAMAQLDPAGAETFITSLHQAIGAIRAIPVPVIARINGYCLGAGLEVAAACDLRVAAENAVLGMPEVKVGIPSVIEAALLPRLIGWGRSAQLLLLGESVGAAEALKIGLIENVVPQAELDQAVEAWIDAILVAGPRAVRLQKALMRQWEELPLAAAIAAGIESFRASYGSDEPRRMMERFLTRGRASRV